MTGVEKIEFELSERFWGFLNQENALKILIPALRSRCLITPRILNSNSYFGA